MMMESVMDVIAEIERLLEKYYEPDEAIRWWQTPTERFDGMCAADMIDAGRSEEVLSALRHLEAAVYL